MSELTAWYVLGQHAKKKKCNGRKKLQILYCRSFSENKWQTKKQKKRKLTGSSFTGLALVIMLNKHCKAQRSCFLFGMVTSFCYNVLTCRYVLLQNFTADWSISISLWSSLYERWGCLKACFWEFRIPIQSEIPLATFQQRQKAVSSLTVEPSNSLAEIKSTLFHSVKVTSLHTLISSKLSRYFNGQVLFGRWEKVNGL